MKLEDLKGLSAIFSFFKNTNILGYILNLGISRRTILKFHCYFLDFQNINIHHIF